MIYQVQCIVACSLYGNRVTGSIPKELGNITTLKSLIIQGCRFSGPIPSEISLMKNLSDLRISDLNGSDSPFSPT
ncbi:hypothetical protein HN51_026421 [Arachis hypogaea]|uniref:LRR receptor kinase SERK2-like n=1 Tax=Arachis duranensis TaxID=130453 RepID=A0A9C6T5G0_ARADU|nr:LRR receptor kinase SERK2-like [Arachis duranensis]